MNAVAFRTVGRYLGAWGVIVLSVILLSVLFTFLGTITSAVLAGMMMGAFKGVKWFSVVVSLVFPGVIFGMARWAKVELTPQQIAWLALLCFGTFWATYFVSAFVFFCEQKDRKPARAPAPASQAETWTQARQVAVTSGTAVAETLGSTELGRESCLDQLQGAWVCEGSGAGHSLSRKVIQIKESKLELKAIDNRGRMTLLASGNVTLQSSRPSRTFFIPQGASEPADFIVGL
jgi:hypothetical protein